MKIKTTMFLVVVLALIVFNGAAVCAGDLRAGLARIDITPEKPVQLMGYSSRTDLSTGVHDPLYARAAVFENDGKRLVLVSTDIIGYYAAYKMIHAELLAGFDLQPDELFLSAIHTHSAPH